MAVIPVQPEPAASVLVLRPASKGFEVLMVHRQDRGVFGGIVVFPGGKVDLVDRSDLSRSAVSGDFDDQADRAAALRELAEETGLAGTTNGVVAAPNVRDEALFSQIESRGEVLDAEAFELTRAVNAGCGLACTIHANSAKDALDALVNAALMAGENVPERVVRKVFGSSINLVVHLGRRADESNSAIVRETLEIRAMVPALHDDFSTEALFERDGIGAPLTWTGALPPDGLVRRLEAVLPNGQSLATVLGGGSVAW